MRSASTHLALPGPTQTDFATATSQLAVNVKRPPYNALGDGVTNDTPAIESAGASLTAGGVLLTPPATYVVTRRIAGDQLSGGILLRPAMLLDGHAATLLLRDNTAFVKAQVPLTTTTATITADVAAGANTFTVSTTTGFSVGAEVFVRYLDNTANPPETQAPFYATITAVGAGTLTLDHAVTQAMTAAGTTAGNRTITQLAGAVLGARVQDLTLTNDETGSANAEAGIDLTYARNTAVANITATNPGAGAVVGGYCQDIAVRNVRVPHSDAQGGAASKGRGFNFWNASNVLVEDAYVGGFQNVAAFLESYCTGVRFSRLWLDNTHPTRDNVNQPLIQVAEGSEVTFDGLRITGAGGTPLIGEGGTTNVIRIRGLNINTTSKLKGGLTTSWLDGGAVLMGTSYLAARMFSLTVRLLPNMSNVSFSLPTGLYAGVRVWLSTLTGLTGFYILGGSGNFDAGSRTGWTAQTSILLSGSDQYGSDYAWNDGGAHQLNLYTDGTVPDGAYLRCEVRYLPPDGVDPATASQLQNTDDLVRGAALWGGGSAWNGGHLMLGAYHLWIDSTGRLRVKSGAPASDTDGTVVGSQS